MLFRRECIVITLICWCLVVLSPVSSFGDDSYQLRWKYDQINPAVAYNCIDDVFLTVYEDHYWGRGNSGDIFGFLDTADGYPRAGIPNKKIIGIGYKGPQNRETPNVVFNKSKGEFLVVWIERNPNYGDSTDVKARIIDRSGQPIGEEFWITSDYDYYGSPKLAYNTELNEYFLVFVQWGFESGISINGLRLDHDGQPIDQLPIRISKHGHSPDVVYCGRYFVVWSDIRNIYDANIYGLFVESDGFILDDEIAIETWDREQCCPKVAFEENNGNLFVVWEDHYWGEGEDSDIFGRMIKNDGSFIGERIGIAYTSKNSERRYSPQVAVLDYPFWQFIVLYEIEKKNITSIAGQIVNTRGELVGSEKYVGPNHYFSKHRGEERAPAIAVAKNKHWVTSDLRKKYQSQVYMAYSRKYYTQREVDRDPLVNYLDFDIWTDNDVISLSSTAEAKMHMPSPKILSFTSTVLNNDRARIDWKVECHQSCKITIDHLYYSDFYKNLRPTGSLEVYRDRSLYHDGKYKLTVQCRDEKIDRTITVPKWEIEEASSSSSSSRRPYYFQVIDPNSNILPCYVRRIDSTSEEAAKREGGLIFNDPKIKVKTINLNQFIDPKICSNN